MWFIIGATKLPPGFLHNHRGGDCLTDHHTSLILKLTHKTLYTLLALVVLASMILAACAPTAPATTEAPPAPVVTEAPTEVPVATEAPTEVPVATEEPTEASPSYEGMMYEAPACNYG